MNAPQRGALMFVRFTAFAVIAVSLLEEGLYVAEGRVHHFNPTLAHGLLLAIPFVCGVVVLIKSRAIAEWISDKLDE